MIKQIELHIISSLKFISILLVLNVFLLDQQVTAKCATSCQGEVNTTVNCGVRKAQECLVLNCNLTRTIWYRNFGNFYLGSYNNNMDKENYEIEIDNNEVDYLYINKLRYVDAGHSSFRAEKIINNKTVGSCSFSIYIYGKLYLNV
jgi:hypothetical protein